MERKHFEAVAASIRAIVDRQNSAIDAKLITLAEHIEAMEVLSNLRHDLSDKFAGFNPRFDRERFDKACGFDLDD